MESLLYILLYICVSRDGPGGHIREELSNEGPTGNGTVHSCVLDYFDSGPAILLENKQALFREDSGPAVLRQNILPYVHPYFESLKPLLQEWHRILLTGYIPQRKNSGFSAMEFVYPWVFFRIALEECLSAAASADEHDQDRYKSMTAAEDDRRRKDRENILKARDDITSDRVVQSASLVPPHFDDSHSQREHAEAVGQESMDVDSSIAIDDQIGSHGQGSMDAGSLEGPSAKRQRLH